MSFDYTGIDLTKIEAGAINLGTDSQDCATIARAFERGANATPTEAAVWAPLSRILNNTRLFSVAASSSISSYIKTPQVAAKEVGQQASQLSPDYGMGANSNNTPKKASVDELMSGVGFGEFKTAITGATKFGEVMAQWAADCIPCSPIPTPGAGPNSPPGLPKPEDMGRVMSFLELNPAEAILNTLEQDIKDKLAVLFSIVDIFTNPPVPADFCNLLEALRPMCVLDLQRMIAMLMALILFKTPSLDGMLDMIGQIVGAIFSPILMAINNLMDMFLQLITAPIRCVIETLELVEANFREIDSVSGGKTNLTASISQAREDTQKKLQEITNQVTSGVQSLKDSLREARKKVMDLAEYYVSELQAILGEAEFGNASFLEQTLDKLIKIRQIMMIVAIIQAKLAGHDICNRSKGESPTKDELDSFFNNYLNPNAPFTAWLDDNGYLHISDEDTGSAVEGDNLSKPTDVLKFDGGGTNVDPSVAKITNDIASALAESPEAVTKCRFDTTEAEAEQINRWIQEMTS